MTKILDDSNFEAEVVNTSGVTLVDFWAEWCGPCQAMLPTLDAFANDMEGKMSVGKINVDDSPTTAQWYRVMSIPTLIIFKDGKAVDQLVWVQTKEQLTAACEKHM